MEEQKLSQPTVADRKSEFVPVEGGGESADAGTLLIVAYVVMWGLVFAAIWLSLRRIAGLRSRVTRLETELAAAEGAMGARLEEREPTRDG